MFEKEFLGQNSKKLEQILSVQVRDLMSVFRFTLISRQRDLQFNGNIKCSVWE